MNRRITDVHVVHLVALERNGRTTAEAILADAKNPASPLHDLYDWDVQRAAEAHWLDRTREIVRLVRYVEHTTHESYRLPRYVRDPDLFGRTQGYVALETLRVDPSRSRRALIAEFERVTAMLQRARHIAIGLALDHEVEDLLARITGLKTILDGDRDVDRTSSGNELRA